MFHRIRLLPQLAFGFKVLGEGFPLDGILFDVGLRALVVDELYWVAVVQVVAWISLVLANRGIVQYKVIEDATVYVGNETADLEQDVLAKAELQPLLMIVHLQLLEKLLVLFLEADFAGADVEPLYVILGEEGVNDRSCTPCLTTCFADVEFGLIHGANSKGLFMFTIIAAARGEEEHGNCHYQGTSPNNLYSHLLYL